MHVRCPHCHNPIEIVGDDFGDIACPSCGSHFSLISADTTTTFRTDGARTIGHFELIHQVGVGAFGSVWKARDTQLDRTVAVKIPRRDQISNSEADAFFREARAAAQLRHPRIVGVHEIGREGDTIYIVSDFVEGANLKEWLSSQRLAPREAAALLAEVADAVDHAHRAGVVHRDLKPGNIMLDLEGRPHVTDFGLAKRDSGEISITLEGKPLGTPHYMPPEQAKGEGHRADRRSDVYSLGVILFELLTGEVPFRGEAQMVLVQIQKDEPPRPRKLNAKIPRDLETITLKCLEKDPAKRYQTAAALGDDLRRCLRGEPIVARRIGRVARGWRWCKREPVIATMAACIVLALAAGSGISTLFAVRSKKDSAEAREATQEARIQKEEAERQKSNAVLRLRYLYSSNMKLAHRAWETSDIGLVLELLQQVQANAGDADLRGWEWYYWRRRCNGDVRTFAANGGEVHAVAFAADGNMLASAGLDDGVTLWDATTGTEIRAIKGTPRPVSSLAFVPGKHWLAVAGRRSILQLWDVETGALIRTLAGHSSVAFSPDGHRLAAASGDTTIKLWDVETGAEIRSFAGHARPVTSVTFSADGRRLASASWDYTVKLWDAGTGVEIRTFEGHRDTVHSVAFCTDVGRLVSAGRDKTLKLWDIETGSEIRTFKGHLDAVTSVACSADGRRLVSGSSDQTVKLWDGESGAEIRTFKGHTERIRRERNVQMGPSSVLWEGHTEPTRATFGGGVTSVALSPDGDLLASGSLDGTVKLWDIGEPTEVRRFAGRADGIFRTTFSPDGALIYTGAHDRGLVKMWDTDTGAETRQGFKTRAAQPVDGLATSPDGQREVLVGKGIVELMDRKSGTSVLRMVCTGPVLGARFSPDGRWLAVAVNESVDLYDSCDFTADEKMGRFLARRMAKQRPSLEDALTEIAKQTHWNEVMREAAIKYVKAALGNSPRDDRD